MKKVRSKLRPTEIGVIKTFSLSPDDEVGEIAVQCSGCTYYYNNLSELCERWEDYEEPKRGWYIDLSCNDILIYEDICLSEEVVEKLKQIGNYFETKEEAEKAVKKFKAWKRLEDKGFRFCGHDDRDRGQLGDIVIYAEMPTFEYDDDSTRDDLDLLFGGEE